MGSVVRIGKCQGRGDVQWVPEALYFLQLVDGGSHRATYPLFGQWRVWAEMQIVQGPHSGIVVPAYWNVLGAHDMKKRPGKRHRLSGRVPRSAKFFMDFRRVTGSVPHDWVWPAEWLGSCQVEARVTTRRKDSQGELVPESARESSVKAILNLVAGTPPVLR